MKSRKKTDEKKLRKKELRNEEQIGKRKKRKEKRRSKEHCLITYLRIARQIDWELNIEVANKNGVTPNKRKKFSEFLLKYSRKRAFAEPDKLECKVETIMQATNKDKFEQFERLIRVSQDSIMDLLQNVTLPIQDEAQYLEFENILKNNIPDFEALLRSTLRPPSAKNEDYPHRQEKREATIKTIATNLTRAFLFVFINKRVYFESPDLSRLFILFSRGLYGDKNIIEEVHAQICFELEKSIYILKSLESYASLIGEQPTRTLYLKVLANKLRDHNDVAMVIRAVAVVREKIGNGQKDVEEYQFLQQVLNVLATRLLEDSELISPQLLSSTLRKYAPGNFTVQVSPNKEMVYVSLPSIEAELANQTKKIKKEKRATFNRALPQKEKHFKLELPRDINNNADSKPRSPRQIPGLIRTLISSKSEDVLRKKKKEKIEKKSEPVVESKQSFLRRPSFFKKSFSHENMLSAVPIKSSATTINQSSLFPKPIVRAAKGELPDKITLASEEQDNSFLNKKSKRYSTRL